MTGPCFLLVVAVVLAPLAGCTEVGNQGEVHTLREPPSEQAPPRPPGRFPDLPLAVKGSDNPSCAQHSAMLEAAILNNTLWGVRMWESSAHVATGWTVGSNIQPGDFDGCFESGAPFQEQFCLVQIHLSPEAIASRQVDPRTGRTMKWGVCVPASCPLEDVERSMNSALMEGMTVSIASHDCDQTVQAKPDFAATITVLLVAVCLGALVTVASIVDSYQDQKQTATAGLGKRLLLCFSAPRNWEELWRPDEVSPHQLPLHAFDAFRIFTAFFVVLGHYCVNALRNPIINPDHYRKMIDEQHYPMITETECYVYTMFVIGGIMTAVVYRNSRKKPIYAVLERYLRLVPMIVLTMLGTLTLFSNINFGPLSSIVRDRIQVCDDTWWLDLIFFANYGVRSEVCLPHLWYLSVDFQMFILSVVLLLPLLRYRRSLGISACVLISLICTAVSFYECYSNGWPHYLKVTMEFARSPTVVPVIMQQLAKTHFNAPCYLLGLCLGSWLVDNNKSENPLKLSKTGARFMKLVGVIFCLGTISVGSTMQAGYGSKVEHATYFAIHRLTFCIGAVLFIAAMMLRPHGGQNVLMKVMARLSFSVYLLHVPVIVAYLVSQRHPIYLNLFSNLTQTLGLFFLIAGLGLIVHIMLEMPFNNIRKVLSFKRKTD